MKRESNQNLSGNEAYYTISLILQVKTCCVVNFIARKVFILFSFHIRRTFAERRLRRSSCFRLAVRCVDHDPAPCTLHPAPRTLHSAPCTLHHAPCTLHPAPGGEGWKVQRGGGPPSRGGVCGDRAV